MTPSQQVCFSMYVNTVCNTWTFSILCILSMWVSHDVSMYTFLLVHFVITLHYVSSSGPTVHCHYVTVVMCFMFTVCYSNTGTQEANNAIQVCMQYQASSTAVHCVVEDASHLEWMKPLGDCLICLGPQVRIHLLHTHGYSVFSCRYFRT